MEHIARGKASSMFVFGGGCVCVLSRVCVCVNSKSNVRCLASQVGFVDLCGGGGR